MPTLILDKLWVNLLSTGTAVSAYSDTRSAQYTNLGQVNHLAGGRQRGVRVVGEQGIYTFTMLEVSQADVVTLRAWKGETVQVRNDRGDKFIGIFFQLGISEVPDRKGYSNVSMSIRVVTADEGL